MQLDHVSLPLVPNNYLPIIVNAGNSPQELFKNPGPQVAHAANNHFIAAAAYLPEAARENPAFTFVIDLSRHVC